MFGQTLDPMTICEVCYVSSPTVRDYPLFTTNERLCLECAKKIGWVKPASHERRETTQPMIELDGADRVGVTWLRSKMLGLRRLIPSMTCPRCKWQTTVASDVQTNLGGCITETRSVCDACALDLLETPERMANAALEFELPPVSGPRLCSYFCEKCSKSGVLLSAWRLRLADRSTVRRAICGDCVASLPRMAP